MDEKFKTWMTAVNSFVVGAAGVEVEDLEDCAYRDWFDNGVKPKTAAKRALKAAGFDIGSIPLW